jgi:hypothetical protein
MDVPHAFAGRFWPLDLQRNPIKQAFRWNALVRDWIPLINGVRNVGRSARRQRGRSRIRAEAAPAAQVAKGDRHETSKAQKRTGDALPQQVQAVIETGQALVQEAKGLGRGR